jgi:hypothetical protein
VHAANLPRQLACDRRLADAGNPEKMMSAGLVTDRGRGP